MIQEYKNDSLISEKPILVHDEFLQSIDMLCQYLKIANCKLQVNSSFRINSDHIQGAIVKPATHSDHFVGCALDANIIDPTSEVWTSEEMKTPTDAVLLFINLVRRSHSPNTLRWGGDFADPDSVHFDNGLYQRSPTRWQEIYNELHDPPSV